MSLSLVRREITWNEAEVLLTSYGKDGLSCVEFPDGKVICKYGVPFLFYQHGAEDCEFVYRIITPPGRKLSDYVDVPGPCPGEVYPDAG